jgi:SPP1 family predicted phage head-tail adaptor
MAGRDLIGGLSRRVLLETPSVGADGRTAWGPLATVWGRVEPIAGTELDADGRLTGAVALRVTIRFRADVTSRERVRLGSRVLAIESARDEDETRRFLVLDCREEGR